MPAQAKTNKLDLEDIPVELSDLKTLEQQLISVRIPFMKIVALPCGKQWAFHGRIKHACISFPETNI